MFGECKVCKAHLKHIEDLQKTIDRLIGEREAERAEYKRAVDALLVQSHAPAIGQGAAENRKPFDFHDLVGMFDEVETAKKEE